MADSVEIPFRDLDELEGATLAERFRLDRMIGRGGYGAVFVGEQVSVQRQCAVKVLVPHVLEQPRNVTRFEREARATSQLAHPNTIVIYDFGLDPKRRLLFLAMEYIDGEALRDRIRRERRLDLETAIWLAHQAAGSLEDAHGHGLVHRDVKPHNIMLTSRGGDDDFVKVIDFGIAKFLDDESIRETFQRVTQTGTIIGTPAYMSPEQVRSEDLDGRADQYALAACVYQMLTGETMFTGKSAVDIATKQLLHRPRRPCEINTAIPPEIDKIIMRALEKDRERRFDTITQFTSALADAADMTISGIDSAERRRAAMEASDSQPRRPAAISPDALGSSTTTEPMAGIEDVAETRSAQLRPIPAAVVRTQPPPKRRFPVAAIGAVAVLAGLVGLAAVSLETADERPEPVASRPSGSVADSTPREQTPVETGASEATPSVDAAEIAAPRRTDDEPSGQPPDVAQPPADRPNTSPETPIAPKSAGSVIAVTVTAVPWGIVLVDGKPHADSRKQTISVPAGPHTFELLQGSARVARKTVDVQPGKNTMVKLIAAP